MRDDLAEQLHAAVERVCPIYSVKIVDPNDRGSWIVQPREDATKAQRAAAQQALADFQYVEKPAPVDDKTRIAQLEAALAGILASIAKANAG